MRGRFDCIDVGGLDVAYSCSKRVEYAGLCGYVREVVDGCVRKYGSVGIDIRPWLFFLASTRYEGNVITLPFFLFLFDHTIVVLIGLSLMFQIKYNAIT